MTTGLTYSQYVTQIALLAVVDPTDANFVSALPLATTYAENRIYRDLDLLATVLTDSSRAFTANDRRITVSIASFVTLQQINVITPASTTNPELGTRNPLLPTTKEFLDMAWPSNSGAGLPTMFGVVNQNNFIVGPWPDATYTVELVGTVRPDSLSVSSPTTVLSLYWPELLVMATMIYISGYQRNFGRQSDDPQMAVSYESQYKTILASATVEEARKKFQSAAWAPQSPPVVATPNRGA